MLEIILGFIIFGLLLSWLFSDGDWEEFWRLVKVYSIIALASLVSLYFISEGIEKVGAAQPSSIQCSSCQ